MRGLLFCAVFTKITKIPIDKYGYMIYNVYIRLKTLGYYAHNYAAL